MTVALSASAWATLGLAALLLLVTVVLTVEVARGHVSVTLPWGRTTMALASREVEIAAPPEIVLQLLASAARGRTPPIEAGERTEVIDEQDGLVVNESLTASRFGLVRAIEMIRIGHDRVGYRHLAGPLPGTEEEFALERSPDGGTVLGYRGSIPVSFWSLGRLVARLLIVPEYERLLDLHIDALKRSAEARAAARRRRDTP